MLLAVDLDENLVDEEGVAVAAMFSLQPLGIEGTKLDTPKTNRLTADDDASLGHEIFTISVARIESVVKPDCVGNDIWRKSVRA